MFVTLENWIYYYLTKTTFVKVTRWCDYRSNIARLGIMSEKVFAWILIFRAIYILVQVYDVTPRQKITICHETIYCPSGDQKALDLIKANTPYNSTWWSYDQCVRIISIGFFFSILAVFHVCTTLFVFEKTLPKKEHYEMSFFSDIFICCWRWDFGRHITKKYWYRGSTKCNKYKRNF